MVSSYLDLFFCNYIQSCIEVVFSTLSGKAAAAVLCALALLTERIRSISFTLQHQGQTKQFDCSHSTPFEPSASTIKQYNQYI